MKKNQVLSLLIFLYFFCFSLFANEPSQSGSGLVLKGGIWGLAGKTTTELENRYFLDDLIDDTGFGHFNTGWGSPNRFYLLNPIGIDYYKSGIGPGSLLLGAELRGIPMLNFTGYTPQYDFLSLSRGTLGIHSADLTFRNLDLNLGYQLTFDKFLVTPKFQIRNFSTDLKESALYLSNGGVGFRDSYFTNNTWTGFIGVNLLYQINESSAAFFEFAMDSPILSQLYSSGDFNKTSFFAGGNNVFGSTSLIKKSLQEIRGTVIDLGYQHTFSVLGLRIGYRSEELRTNYINYTDVPISFNSNGDFDIDIEETILNSIFYGNSSTTTLRSLYVTAIYKF